ncbi:hypothetical protein ACOMHN_020011 [Nucella lapillus]
MLATGATTKYFFLPPVSQQCFQSVCQTSGSKRSHQCPVSKRVSNVRQQEVTPMSCLKACVKRQAARGHTNASVLSQSVCQTSGSKRSHQCPVSKRVSIVRQQEVTPMSCLKACVKRQAARGHTNASVLSQSVCQTSGSKRSRHTNASVLSPTVF